MTDRDPIFPSPVPITTEVRHHVEVNALLREISHEKQIDWMTRLTQFPDRTYSNNKYISMCKPQFFFRFL
jgi:hypothetical protein